jgi:hypothetical protein
MLNLKKGLALVLAAATAFTFAPVGNLSAPVTAKAAPVANATFTTGGVLNTIYAYKGASYDLAEHASVTYGNTRLTGRELKWYLVDSSAVPNVGDTRNNGAITKLKSVNIPTTAGTVESGQSGSLKVTVNDPDVFMSSVAHTAYTNANPTGAAAAAAGVDTKIVAVAYVAGAQTVVYVSGTNFAVKKLDGNVKSVGTISDSVQSDGTVQDVQNKEVLDKRLAIADLDNTWVKASQVNLTATGSGASVSTDTNYNFTAALGTNNDNPFKKSTLTRNNYNSGTLEKGTYYETAYIPFKLNGDNDTTYVVKADLTVTVGAAVLFRVKDGGSLLASSSASDVLAKDHAVYVNLTDNKTWDIRKHIETDAVDQSKVTFEYDSDSANVDVDKNGVITAKSVGNANITITATYNGLKSSAKLLVRVSQYGFDKITITGKDKDVATALTTTQYDNNQADIKAGDATLHSSEYELVTRQIGYVQIEVTGNETSNVVETPVVASANNARLTYSFVEDYSAKGLTIDPTTGAITVDYNKIKAGTALGTYAVKVVSDATSKSESTTSYYYVVVDYPDQTITGLNDRYADPYVIGVASAPDKLTLDLHNETNGTAKSYKKVTKDDDFAGAPIYSGDSQSSFDMQETGAPNSDQTEINDPYRAKYSDKYSGRIWRADAADKTMHVIAYNVQQDKKGFTAKLVTVKSAPAVTNYVDKITNKATGDVIYDYAKDKGKTAAHISINDITTVDITLAHPVASAVSGSAVHLNINYAGETDKVINQSQYVTAVLNTKEVAMTLYPNSRGTTVISVNPAGWLTATDRTDIHHQNVLLAIEYDGSKGNLAKPAKITGVKVGNKKGAKVVVKFTKSSLDKNGLSMKYYVQKKVGKKTSGKSIGSTRTTLSVKKGATVKVRVKAYYYDAAGQKHVGAYSKWVTKKTDKK